MALLALSHVNMHFGGPLLLDDVTLDIEKGAKIGVIGQNGAGKSTLLNLLRGALEPAAGRVVRQRGVTLAHQAQELDTAVGATVYGEMERVFAADLLREKKLRRLEERLAEGLSEKEQGGILEQYELLQDRHAAAGGYDIGRRIETVLSSLGLPRSAWNQPIESFSGGERNVVGLARVLLTQPDVMLLDEPSNHLDMDGIEWFIRFLRATTACVVMVSHNRHILDATVNAIWQVRRGKVTTWAGNYSDYQRRKAEALALQERRFKVQQRLIRRIEFQARRLGDMANAYDDPGQAKRAKAMLRRLDRMDKIERPDGGEQRFHASLAGGKRHGDIALRVEKFSFGYGERVLFEDADLEINSGERVCLVGPNGSGKTTLLRQIIERGSWDNPGLRLGKSVKIGEYAQLHENAMDAEETLIDWTSRVTGLWFQPASELLHRFLFKRDDLERPIATLSGGEKSRLQLARLVHDKVNFLVLDEPTNHLDIQACEQLEEMLEEFDGTLLVVSHDRYFLDRLVNRVVEVRDKKLVLFRDSFAKWWRDKQAAGGPRRRAALELRSRRDAHHDLKEKAKEERRKEKERRKELHRLRARLLKMEERIEQLEARQAQLGKELEKAYSFGADRDRADAINADFESNRRRVAKAYTEWERIAAAIKNDSPGNEKLPVVGGRPEAGRSPEDTACEGGTWEQEPGPRA